MSDKHRYIPVVRWRPAERQALNQLSASARNVSIPLIEILRPRQPRYTAAERLAYITDVVNEIADAWGTTKAYLDAEHLKPHFHIDNKSPLRAAIALARKSGALLVPVIQLPRETINPRLELFEAAEDARQGLCLRLKPIDFELKQNEFVRLIEAVLRRFDLDPRQIDLIVDEEFTYDLAPSYAEICSRIPWLLDWRSFAVLSGDFPADLQRFQRGQIRHKARNDWKRWRSQTHLVGLPRIPDYGDYTVQYPAHRPLPPGEIPNPSVSVRYTADDDWLICRGEAIKESGPGTEQWLGWAKVLKELPEFRGATFSAGDEFIDAHTVDGVGHGNFTLWIAAGINHHITLATEQLAKPRAA